MTGNADLSRRLAALVQRTDLTVEQRLAISTAALTARTWSDLPAWVRALDS
jgi:hypothetical protein